MHVGGGLTMMSGGEAVAAALETLGVRHVFGIVSVHNLPIYEALSRSESIEVVNVRHEQAAAHAADAYARTTGSLGVLLTSTGPGAANAVAGLYEAAFVSSRVMMITGQTESRFYGKAKGFLHENERQVEMLRSVCRRVASVRATEDIAAEVLAVAADVCSGRPQPGAVEIPIDLQYNRTEIIVPHWQMPAPVAPPAESLDAAAEALAKAERPLIWAGGGVNISGASVELTELATTLGACVVTTIEGRGAIAEDHPLSLGFCSDRRATAEVFAEADALVAVGTRFQNYATRVWKLELPEELIHLDVDPTVIGLNYPASVAVVGDAKLGLAGLAERLAKKNTSADPGYVERAKKWRSTDIEELREEIGEDHAAISDAIRRLAPRETAIVRDSTIPAYTWANRLLPILAPRTSIRPGAVAIGPGVPLAIGAAVGSGAPTVVIQGDGGLMLSVGELSACAEHNLGVIVLVFNDSGYGVLRVIQDSIFDTHHGTELKRVDYVQVAKAMGLAAEAVASVGEFESAFEAAISRATSDGGATLIEIDLAALEPISFGLPAHQRRNR